MENHNDILASSSEATQAVDDYAHRSLIQEEQDANQWKLHELFTRLQGDAKSAEYASAIYALDYLSIEQKYVLLWYEDDDDICMGNFIVQEEASIHGVEWGDAINLLIEHRETSPVIVKRIKHFFDYRNTEEYISLCRDISGCERYVFLRLGEWDYEELFCVSESECIEYVAGLIKSGVSPLEHYSECLPDETPFVNALQYKSDIAMRCVEYIEGRTLAPQVGFSFSFDEILKKLFGRVIENVDNVYPNTITRFFYNDVEIPEFLFYDIALYAIKILKSRGWTVEEKTYQDVPVALVHVNKIIVKR